MKKWLGLLFLGSMLHAADVAETAQAMLPEVKEKTITYVGEDGWLYSKNELEHLAAGPFAGGRVKEVSKATKSENADPIPAIVDFNEQLKALGIQLIVMPVPPKLAVYPADGLETGEAAQYLQELEKELSAQGVEILDLTPDFIAAHDRGVYCKTDSHWSPAGIAVAAAKLAERIGLKGETGFPVVVCEELIAGDLALSLDKNAVPSESVTLQTVSGEVFSDDSPVLLLSDSHGLIFSSGGDMLAEGAGLGEQLAVALQMSVDRMAVKGSASTPVRVNLYRKAAKDPAWLQNKKFVIWVFTCREFTESANGWAKVPVIKK